MPHEDLTQKIDVMNSILEESFQHQHDIQHIQKSIPYSLQSQSNNKNMQYINSEESTNFHKNQVKIIPQNQKPNYNSNDTTQDTNITTIQENKNTNNNKRNRNIAISQGSSVASIEICNKKIVQQNGVTSGGYIDKSVKILNLKVYYPDQKKQKEFNPQFGKWIYTASQDLKESLKLLNSSQLSLSAKSQILKELANSCENANSMISIARYNILADMIAMEEKQEKSQCSIISIDHDQGDEQTHTSIKMTIPTNMLVGFKNKCQSLNGSYAEQAISKASIAISKQLYSKKFQPNNVNTTNKSNKLNIQNNNNNFLFPLGMQTAEKSQNISNSTVNNILEFNNTVKNVQQSQYPHKQGDSSPKRNMFGSPKSEFSHQNSIKSNQDNNNNNNIKQPILNNTIYPSVFSNNYISSPKNKNNNLDSQQKSIYKFKDDISTMQTTNNMNNGSSQGLDQNIQEDDNNNNIMIEEDQIQEINQDEENFECDEFEIPIQTSQGQQTLQTQQFLEMIQNNNSQLITSYQPGFAFSFQDTNYDQNNVKNAEIGMIEEQDEEYTQDYNGIQQGDIVNQ